MTRPKHRLPLDTFSILAVAAVLAWEPAHWLIRTWTQPAYGSDGIWVFALCVALAARSYASPIRPGTPPGRPNRAVRLLLGVAVIRAFGELLAIRLLGGITLAVDVFALATLARLDRRSRPLSPGWLAALFLLSLPLERVAQRIIGFPLQLLSAKGACGVLTLGWRDVTCEGVNIDLAGTPVLVDLPCSGTAGLFVVAVVFTGLCAMRRPSRRDAAQGAAIAFSAGLVANALRISALTSGIARGGALTESFEHGLAHEAVGLIALALAIIPVVAWADRVEPVSPKVRPSTTRRPVSRTLAAGALGLCLVSLLVPHRPIDISDPFPELSLPHTVAGVVGLPVPLTERETAVYNAHGGTAIRARYGAHTLLAVRTSSPLRHLHSPEECLRALGAEVTRLGVSYEGVPAAVYRIIHPDGEVYRVAVTFLGSDGTVATSVAEAVFHWLRNPNTTWTAVQRIAPWDIAEAHGWLVDRELAAAFDLPIRSI